MGQLRGVDHILLRVDVGGIELNLVDGLTLFVILALFGMTGNLLRKCGLYSRLDERVTDHDSITVLWYGSGV